MYPRRIQQGKWNTTFETNEIKTARDIGQRCTDAVEHADDVFGVDEGSDLLAALPVDDGQRLQAQTLHGHLGREQEAMVQLVEELIPRERETLRLLRLLSILQYICLAECIFKKRLENT